MTALAITSMVMNRPTNTDMGVQQMSRIPLRLKKIALTATAAVMAGISLAAVNPTAASAAGITVRILPESNPFLFLDVAGSSTAPGAGVIQYSYTGGLNQVWRIRPAGGYYEIVNRWSGQCLTTDEIAGHQLYQWPCDGDDNQKWDTDLTPGSVAAYQIRNPASGLQVDIQGGSGAQGTPVIGWTWNGGVHQYFYAHSA
jgi:hypothetical protein